MTLDNSTRSVAHLELLGIGSHRHKTFKHNLLKAMEDLNIVHPVSEVTSLGDLLNYNITGIPALVINGRVVFQNEVPSIEDLKVVLSSVLAHPRARFSIDKILVPTDFSEAADNAYRYAGRLAKTLDAQLKLVHIHQEVSTVASLSHLPIGQPELIQMKKDLLDQRVKELSNGAFSLDVEQELLVGSVQEQLKALGTGDQYDLMVLGATGEGATRLDRIGSHASSIARKADCPVLLVPEEGSFQPFRRILFASKLTPGEESVWPKAVSMAAHFGAEIHFVHIQDNQVNGYHLGQAQGGAYALDKGTFIRMATLKAKNVIDGLNQYVEDQEADLLIMPTTHRNFLQDLFHKSATHRMIFTTQIPLLVLHFSMSDTA